MDREIKELSWENNPDLFLAFLGECFRVWNAIKEMGNYCWMAHRSERCLGVIPRDCIERVIG